MANTEKKATTAKTAGDTTQPNATVDSKTGVSAERVPAPDRVAPAAPVHTNETELNGQAKALQAASDANKPDPGEASTVAPPPVKDPERAEYGTTVGLGLRTRGVPMLNDPNEVLPEQDRKFATATRDRWAQPDTATIREEQREIARQIREAGEK